MLPSSCLFVGSGWFQAGRSWLEPLGERGEPRGDQPGRRGNEEHGGAQTHGDGKRRTATSKPRAMGGGEGRPICISSLKLMTRPRNRSGAVTCKSVWVRP